MEDKIPTQYNTILLIGRKNKNIYEYKGVGTDGTHTMHNATTGQDGYLNDEQMKDAFDMPIALIEIVNTNPTVLQLIKTLGLTYTSLTQENLDNGKITKK